MKTTRQPHLSKMSLQLRVALIFFHKARSKDAPSQKRSFQTHTPFCDQLVPVREGGEDGHEFVPQLSGDANVQVGLHESHDQGLESRKTDRETELNSTRVVAS